jgi:predicted AlkP superfamily phosphohydrolase/phosphomutase
MSPKLLAVSIDAPAWPLLRRWMDAGDLPVLAGLRRQGAVCPLRAGESHLAEVPWTALVSGQTPEHTGYWTPIRYDMGGYTAQEVGAYRYDEFPPFYALGDQARVLAFDLPQVPPLPSVNGVQALWGAHSPQTPRASLPAGLLGEMDALFGPHPSFEKDSQEPWQSEEIARLVEGLLEGAARRTQIVRHLMGREHFDLVLTAYGEPHSAGHALWHLSQPDHPLHFLADPRAPDPMLRVMQAVDTGIGALLADLPAETPVAVFSIEGMGPNSQDVPSMFFLPELMYRYSFPGRTGFADRRRTPPPAPQQILRNSAWVTEVWAQRSEGTALQRLVRRHPGLKRVLRGVDPRRSSADGPQFPSTWKGLNWNPAMWYRHLWPRMQAYALPSFSNGYVRVNLAGREPAGTVPPARYSAVLDEIEAHVRALRDPRTGRSVVANVRRPREGCDQSDPRLPDADLEVLWTADPFDAVESEALGRVGPVPYRRAGGHTTEGFILMRRPDLVPGEYGQRPTMDIAPTLLDLAGLAAPRRLDGESILPRLKPRRAA